MRQPISDSEVDKFLPIVARDAALCAKPHHAIRVLMDGKDMVIRQSLKRGIVPPRSLLEIREVEIDIPESFTSLDA